MFRNKLVGTLVVIAATAIGPAAAAAGTSNTNPAAPTPGIWAPGDGSDFVKVGIWAPGDGSDFVKGIWAPGDGSDF